MAWAGGDRIVRVIMRATRGAEQQVNTLHYRLHEVSVGESNDVQALGDFFRDNVMTPFRLLTAPTGRSCRSWCRTNSTPWHLTIRGRAGRAAPPRPEPPPQMPTTCRTPSAWSARW